MKIDVTYDGVAHPFDFGDMTLPEYFTVKKVAGLNGGDFQTQVMEFNPAALLALVVLALRRGGVPVVAKDIDQDKVDIPALVRSLAAGVDAARAELRAAATE